MVGALVPFSYLVLNMFYTLVSFKRLLFSHYSVFHISLSLKRLVGTVSGGKTLRRPGQLKQSASIFKTELTIVMTYLGNQPPLAELRHARLD